MIDKTILNLKKLKSFHIHNGNYDPDIDRAIKAIEQQSNMVSRIAYEQVMWERDVAINQLKELGYGFGEKIKTDKDAISRQETIEAFQMFREYEANRTNAEWVNRIETVVKKLPSVNQEPMREFTEEEAKAYSKALDKMYKPTGFNVFNEPCGDCINRQVIKEQMIKYGFHAPDMTVTEFVEDLLPVKPQESKIAPIAEIKFDDDMLHEIVEEAVKNIEIEPKTGHWEWVQYNYNPQLGNWHCSECRCVVVECVGKEEKGGIPLYKYCPQCGAKMEVSE